MGNGQYQLGNPYSSTVSPAVLILTVHHCPLPDFTFPHFHIEGFSDSLS